MASNPKLDFRTFLFGRVFSLERHEYVAVAWSFAYFFCILSSYYIIRPMRETMAVGSGADTIPYLFLATFVVMFAITPVFGWIASRYPRRVFLPWVYLFFISNILVFWVIFGLLLDHERDNVWLGRIFVVWLSIFNLFVVSVFWSFMVDIYTREQGRRLFGFITAGGSIGALLGSAATSLLVVRIGTHNLLPIAAAVLLVAVLCIRRLRQWVSREHENDGIETMDTEKPLGGSAFAGITHIYGSKYFSGIAVSSVIASLLGTALYMFAAQMVETSIADPDERTRFFSNINVASNFFSLIGQMFIVRHVVRRFGIGTSLSLLPLVSIASFLLLAIDPVLGVVAFMTAARRALGFSFSKPTTDMLYSVVTLEEKYKTKNFIDTAIYRFGDVVGSFSIKFLLGLGISGVSIIMLPFAAIWAAISIWLGRDYRRRAKTLKDSGVA